MSIGVAIGLFCFLSLMLYCEILEKALSDSLLIFFVGIGFVNNSYLGGLGSWLSLEPSLMRSLLDCLIAFLFYLPYRRFYPNQWTLLLFLVICALFMGPVYFFHFYFYTALVCSLLSLLLIVSHSVKNKAEVNVRDFFKWKPEGKSGVRAPYFTSGFLAFAGMLFFQGFYNA